MIVERCWRTSSRMRGDRRPDAAPCPSARPQSQPLARCTLSTPLQISHIVDRDLDRDLQLLDPARVDDAHSRWCRRGSAPSRSGPLGRREADSLRLGFCQRHQPLEAEREVPPRLVSAIEWISSTITQRTLGRIWRAALVQEQEQ